MATINDFKVKDEDFDDLDIMSLPSRPSAAGMSAAQLQERFDAGSKQVIRPKLNALIDLLNGTEGADNIGITTIEGLSGYTVQQILLAIKLLLDDKKNTEQSDREIAQKFDTAEAQALVKEITFSEGSGVFTITKYDGSVKTIDTAIEKVALDVRLDGQQFVLTLADGTEQRVDLSAFLTQTEVKNSDTITLAIESGVIVARLVSGSVKLAHLNAEVTAYIEEKEQSAKNSADAAKVSEQNALNSANSAEQSYQNARACQEQSCLCATQAELSRDAAKASEQAAKASEQAAKEAAQEAKDYSGGDFVTNTEFNQFKETVPTLDDGKVSVQQGGLYINSETTEEDKAEAQEGFRSLGFAVKSYTSLSALGFTTESFSETDLSGNLIAIYKALVNFTAEVRTQISTSYSLSKSIRANLKAEAMFDLETYYNITVVKETNVLKLYVKPIFMGKLMHYTKTFMCMLRYQNEDDWVHTPFVLVEDIEGFVPVSELHTQIQKLIDSGVIEVGALNVPIKMQNFYINTNSGTVSGTGKGTIFITSNGNMNNDENKPTFVFDGTTIKPTGNLDGNSLQGIEINFKKSFSIKTGSLTNDSYGSIGGTILFY